jgi:hypothetical protein
MVSCAVLLSEHLLPKPMKTLYIILVSVVVLALLVLAGLRIFSKRSMQPELVRVDVGEDKIREMLKGARDFRIRVGLDGTVTAHCKSCNVPMRTAEQDEIFWFRCPGCNRVSICPAGNIARDTQFAIKDGKPFEYELYFLKDLPPELKSPI